MCIGVICYYTRQILFVVLFATTTYYYINILYIHTRFWGVDSG